MWLNFAGEMYMEMNGVKEICVLGFLGINSWIDIRKKQVALLLIIIFAVCGTVWTIYSRRNVPEVLMCVGTGFLFVLISILTEGAVGMGDGWLLMALGTVLYPEEFFSTLFMGMICSAVWSGIMYESAVSGSMEGIKKNGEIYDTARMRSEELGSIGFFGAENLGTQTNVGKEVQVTYDLDTISSYGNLSWHLRTEGKSAVINPVKHIRRLRAAQAVLREMGE